MGIRIRRMLGYGLTDLVENDPRINWDSPAIRTEGREPTVADYREWLGHVDGASPRPIEFAMLNPDNAFGAHQKYRAPYDCITYRDEYGLPEVLCITPVWMSTQWYRYDDMIDWVLDSYVLDKNPEDWVKVLPHGIYPYNSSFMDSRTGERVKSEIMPWIRAQSAIRDGHDLDEQALDALAEIGGFETNAEAVAYCHPLVPEEIGTLASFGEIFTEHDRTILECRPMLYTYWA